MLIYVFKASVVKEFKFWT